MTTTQSEPVPHTGRIAGTLHTRGHVRPIPVQDESLAREKAHESEVADRHRDSRQEGDKDGC